MFQRRPRLKKLQEVGCKTSGMTLPNQFQLEDVGSILRFGAGLYGRVSIAHHGVVVFCHLSFLLLLLLLLLLVLRSD